MLAEPRWVQATPAVARRHRGPDLHTSRAPRDEPPRGHLLVRRDLVKVEHRFAARIKRSQLVRPFIARPRGKDLFQRSIHLLLGIALRELHLDEVRPAEPVA